MTYNDYTRDALLDGLRDHFGLEVSTDNDNLLIRALDEAQEQIIRKRRSWHFLERPLVVDIGPSKTGTATFTQGSKTAAFVAGTVPAAYDQLVDEDTSNITQGFRVVSYGAPTITLDSNYVQATGLKTYTSVQGYFPLPENFMSMDGPLWDVEDIRSRIHYRPPNVFENIIRNKTVTVGRPIFYTVISDPAIEADPQLVSRRQYLVVYPYVMSRTTLRGLYQVHPQKLDNANAIPILPREFRPVLIDVARWLVAIRLRLEGGIIQSYLQLVTTSITDMLKEHEFSDDVDDHVGQSGFGFDFPIEGQSSLGDNFQDFI